MADKASRTTWLAGLFTGVLAGLIGLVIPIMGIGMAIAATVLVLLRGPRTLGLGGIWLGFGSLWSLLLLRAGVECALNPASSDGCSSLMFQSYLVVGILMAVAGLLVTVVAFRGRHATRDSGSTPSEDARPIR